MCIRDRSCKNIKRDHVEANPFIVPNWRRTRELLRGATRPMKRDHLPQRIEDWRAGRSAFGIGDIIDAAVGDFGNAISHECQAFWLSSGVLDDECALISFGFRNVCLLYTSP